MALLNNLFDILRGWPVADPIAEAYPVHQTVGAYDVLPPGTVVQLQLDGTAAKATTPNLAAADGIPVWVVIESNQDFSGQFLQKVVLLRCNAEFRLDPSNFTAGGYVVGTLLSFNTGQFTLALTTNQVIGEVLQDNRAIDGTLKIFYHGGMYKKF